MAETLVNPGCIDWTGENPGMYLKETADGPYTCLASFFRVFYSPHGPGHALFLLWDAQQTHAYNACYSDNERLAEYLRDGFLTSFPAFRGNVLVDSLPLRRASSFGRGGDPRSEYLEVVEAQGYEIRLTWRGLGNPYLVQVPPADSSTGAHQLFSVFFDAPEAEVVVNGQRAAGTPFARERFGHLGSTAFLAFAESWLRPG